MAIGSFLNLTGTPTRLLLRSDSNTSFKDTIIFCTSVEHSVDLSRLPRVVDTKSTSILYSRQGVVPALRGCFDMRIDSSCPVSFPEYALMTGIVCRHTQLLGRRRSAGVGNSSPGGPVCMQVFISANYSS